VSRRCPFRERTLKSLVAGALIAGLTVIPVSHADATPPSKVAVIVMENHPYGAIIGNRAAPYTNRLAKTYALATHYFAIRHPSLPNYLALTSGDTQGVTRDCTTCHFPVSNIADSLEAVPATWTAFMQSMPSTCFLGANAGRYVKRHNPFLYYDDIATDPARCNAHVLPLTSIDYANLPDFTWITPNLCNDTHDCSVATGDRFLKRFVPNLLTALGPGGVLFLTWDEGSHRSNHIATIVAGDGATPGTYPGAFNHYSLLRTVEDHFGAVLTGNAATATTMSGMIH